MDDPVVKGNPGQVNPTKFQCVLRQALSTICIYLAVRWAMGDPLPGAVVLVRMAFALLLLIYVMEWLEDDSSQAVVGVARANVGSKVLDMITK